MKLRLTILCGLAGVLAAMFAPSASAVSLSPPGGFRLSASNGYSIHALAYDGDPHGNRDELILFVGRKQPSVAYFVLRKVTVTETEIEADLGSLGSVDLQFLPSGHAREERSSCDPRRFRFDSGSYEGRFDFVGEEGFTEVHASHARGEIRVALSLICFGSSDEGFGGHSPGARLRVRRGWSDGKVELEVRKNSPTRPARFSASIEERRPGMAIFREVEGSSGPGAFDFDVPEQFALLRPPAPFAGSARFDGAGAGPGRLRGDLSVDFPGHSNVLLHGARGSLQRYVQNPAHPFRLQ
jgi:hypothetical protein